MAAPMQAGSKPAQEADLSDVGPNESSPGRQATNGPEEIPPPMEMLKSFGQDAVLVIQPVPTNAWESLPASCLRRMLEFEAVRAEYERTFKQSVTEELLDPADRVNLENILEIALINSREYQTRKETLYRVALRLSLERFAYDLRFLRRGNGTSLDYTHARTGGTEVNRLGAATGVGITRSLYTAGELTARFANDVLLTFNGPSGYSASVGSEILVDLSQPLIQRDIRFESLTQAERDVVYAARDFVRFRKILFRDLAGQYYNLLLTYRSIAINTQDYFSNLREFNRASATEQAGRLPPFQVDQFEQNVLRSRGNLINSCNALEGALDRLKLRIGLPTELPLNVALSELEELTLRDEVSVILEQIERKREFLKQQQERLGSASALSAATQLARSMYDLAQARAKLNDGDEQLARELELLIAQLNAEESRTEARENELVLNQDGDDAQTLQPAQIFLRTGEVIRFTLEAVQKEIILLQLVHRDALADASSSEGKSSNEADQAGEQAPTASPPADDIDEPVVRQLASEWQTQVIAFDKLGATLSSTPSYEQQSLMLPDIIRRAQELLEEVKLLERRSTASLADAGIQLAKTEADLATLEDFTLDSSLSSTNSSAGGLAELEVDMDEAVMTALVQRLDLMNTRGELADAWRQIKYAGDDLRSILNLRASQSIRTRTGSNNPFDFTFDDSTTRLGFDFDSPLNRRVERNNFRLALINYNLAIRNLLEAQDTVKLNVRDDLRAIELDRNQYDIAIASAELAYERVTSTRLQLGMGLGNVTARDFLEAQQAYTQSLSAVAQQHIGYIVDRIQFFLDVEQLQVDAVNFWPDLRNEEYEFLPATDFILAMPHGYGNLPCGPWYSKCIRRQEQVPPGNAMIHRAPGASVEPSKSNP
jgi:outer membrane protein TolC